MISSLPNLASSLPPDISSTFNLALMWLLVVATWYTSHNGTLPTVTNKWQVEWVRDEAGGYPHSECDMRKINIFWFCFTANDLGQYRVAQMHWTFVYTWQWDGREWVSDRNCYHFKVKREGAGSPYRYTYQQRFGSQTQRYRKERNFRPWKMNSNHNSKVIKWLPNDFIFGIWRLRLWEIVGVWAWVLYSIFLSFWLQWKTCLGLLSEVDVQTDLEDLVLISWFLSQTNEVAK